MQHGANERGSFAYLCLELGSLLLQQVVLQRFRAAHQAEANEGAGRALLLFTQPPLRLSLNDSVRLCAPHKTHNAQRIDTGVNTRADAHIDTQHQSDPLLRVLSEKPAVLPRGNARSFGTPTTTDAYQTC